VDDQLTVSIRLENDKVRFRGTARSLPAVTMDYFPPLGDGAGYTGLELLLLSLAACSGSTVVPLLRRMKKTVTGLEIRASGVRRAQHPTSFTSIALEFRLTSPDVGEADMEQAVAMAKETFCPVWAMLKGNVEITPSWTIAGV